MLKTPKEVIIVGAGPVGLMAALFLKKYKIDFCLIEKKKTLSTHPSAHYLNMRTMEVFSEIEGLDKSIYQRTENIEFYRYYRYCRRLFEKEGLFAISDHFKPSVEEKFRELEAFSFRKPVHLPQFNLVEILYKKLMDENLIGENILFGKEFEDLLLNRDQVEINVKDHQENKNLTLSSKYLFAADGFHSLIRSKLEIKMLGFPQLQSFINIFFQSKPLASLIKIKKEFAMLHFIYNSNICAVLVNHSLEEGLFVLQIPIHPPFDDFNNFKSNENNIISMILSCFAKNSGLKSGDFLIKNVGMWELSGQVAEKYYENRCFLMGDSAHSFPPAGGFGLNTGIQDLHNLIHKLVPLLKKQSSKPFDSLASEYSLERKQIGVKNLNTAMKYYEKSLEIPRLLGLNIQNLRNFKVFLENFSILPKRMLNFAFNSGIKIGSYPIEFRSFIKEKQILIDDKNKIPLIFIEEDVGFRYKSFQEENIAGILCPLFYFDIIKRDQQTKISSREFVRSIPELMKENIVREMSGYKEELYGDYVVIFGRVGAYLNEMKNLGVSSKCNRVFLINIEEDIDKILKSDHINQVFMRADQLNKLKEMPKIFSVRSDGHLN